MSHPNGPREPRALTRNADDPQQVARAEREEKRHRRDELADLRTLLALPEGRRVLWRFLNYCGPFRSVMENDSPYHTAYNAGRQDVGHFLQAEIVEADDERYLLMMREAKEREQGPQGGPEPNREETDDVS